MFFLMFFLFILLIFLFFTKKKIKINIFYVLVISVLVRALILLVFPKSQSEDLLSFLTSGEILISRKPIYPTLYFPFMPYLGLIVLKLKTIINPLIFLKIFFSLFDVAIIYLIYLISNSSQLALIYGLNPVTLLNTTIHGQFDTIPLFFLVLGVYLFIKKKEIFSILSLSMGIYTKTWPFLFSPLILRKLKNKWIFILAALFPLVSVLFYWKLNGVNPIQILIPIKNYRGLYGFWGITEITNFFWPKFDGSWIQLMRRIFLISFLIYSLTFQFKEMIKGISKQMLFFFIFTITFGVQWLTWLIPFLILSKVKYQKIFFSLATFYLALAYYHNVYNISLTGPTFYYLDSLRKVLGLAVWLIMILMFRQKNF